MKELGYEVVPDADVKVGDKRTDVGAAIGSAATLALGGGMRGVVMRMPKEWYDEAQRDKMQDISRIEETLKAKNLDGTYGKFEVSRD